MSTEAPKHVKGIHIYLIVYFALLAGAAIALWQGGVLGRLSPLYLLLTAIVVVGLGLVLAVTSASSPARD